MATKLEKLLQKEAQLKAQIQQAKAAERTLEKKRDTRRKILIGAAVMARVERGEWPEADLRLMMDGFLSRANERELFGLDAGADETDADAGSLSAAVRTRATKAKPVVDERKRKAAAVSKRRFAEPTDDLEKEFNL